MLPSSINTALRNRRLTTSSEMRARLLAYLQSNPEISVSTAARVFQIPISSAHAIVRRSENTEQALPVRRGGARSRKMTQSGLVALALWVDERPFLTLNQLCIMLETQLAIAVTPQTVSCALTKIGFTIKLLRKLPE